jgi:hypothetical protein
VRYAIAFCLVWGTAPEDVNIGEVRKRANEMTRLVMEALGNPDAPRLADPPVIAVGDA